MSRNRAATDPISKQPSISNVSSNVPVMATTKDEDTPTDLQSSVNPFKTNTNRDSKRGRTVCQPKGTIPYTVTNSDTLQKIALHYNLTPSELLQLNKLNSRTVFPGQILYVPEASSSSINDEEPSIPIIPLVSPPLQTRKSKDEDTFILRTDRRLSSGSSPPPTQQDVGAMIWSMTRQTSAKPGHAERLKSDASTESESSSSRTIEDRLKTQKGDNTKQVKQVQRTLSMEENQRIDEECLQRFIKLNVRLMTDDHKSVAGTLLVTPNAVMFDPDVLDPLVKEHGIDKYGLIIRMDLLAGIALYEDIAMYEHEATSRDEEKRKMCHSTSIKSLHHSSPILLNRDDEEIHVLMSSLLDKVDKELNSSNDTSFMLFNASSSSRHHTLSETEELFSSPDEWKNSSGILIDESDIPPQECLLENCIPVDEFNKRFGEIDKLLQKQHEIYVTPHPIEIPYYLCIKTSTLTNNIVINQERQNKKHIDNIYGRKDLDHEYWFSVPKEKIDHLYTFFLRWNPECALDPSSDGHYPEDGNALSTPTIRPSPKQNEGSTAKGFVLLANDDPELSDDYITTKNKNTNSSKSRTLSDSEQKKQHYLKRQNTLLKEWEVNMSFPVYSQFLNP